MASFAPPLISLGSLTIMATSSLQELVTTFPICTSENAWKTILGTSISLLISQSYV
jgi:hypothetical protein